MLAIFLAIICSGMAMPIIWFIIRWTWFIDPLLRLFGGSINLMYAGGLVFGAMVGVGAMVVILKVLQEWSCLAIIGGGIGGAIGGLASSIMFFPLVAIL